MTPQRIKDAAQTVMAHDLQRQLEAQDANVEILLQQKKELTDRAQGLVNALEWIKTYGPVDNLTVKFIDNALAKWKGEGEQGKPEMVMYNLNIEEKKNLLAGKIEVRMKETGLNRQQFADLMKTQPSTITRWLSGDHNFQIDTLFEIEKQLNISLFKL